MNLYSSSVLTVGSTGYFFDLLVFGLLVLFCLILFAYVIISGMMATTTENYLSKRDAFEETNGYTYDYAFVFKVYEEDEVDGLNEFQQHITLKNFIDRCEQAQLSVKAYYSCQRDEIYCKIRADPDRLLKEAARIEYKLQLHPSKLRIAGQTGNAGKWKPFTITDEFGISRYQPYDYIYAKFVLNKALLPLFQQYPANPTSSKYVYQQLRPIDRYSTDISMSKNSLVFIVRQNTIVEIHF
jgi:hypothetical protein